MLDWNKYNNNLNKPDWNCWNKKCTQLYNAEVKAESKRPRQRLVLYRYIDESKWLFFINQRKTYSVQGFGASYVLHVGSERFIFV